MAKSLEQRLEELDAKRDALKRQMRDRDKRERQRADAALLRAVKDCFGDDITDEQIRQRFGKAQADETPMTSERSEDVVFPSGEAVRAQCELLCSEADL